MGASKEELENRFRVIAGGCLETVGESKLSTNAACETKPPHTIDTNEVSGKLETSITQLIGDDHYNAAASRFQDLTSKRPKPNIDVFAKSKATNENTVKKLNGITADETFR